MQIQEAEYSSIASENEFIHGKSQLDSIKKIQGCWRIYKSYKLLQLLKETHSHSSYFSKEDLKLTLSQKFFTNSRKKRKVHFPNGHFYEGDFKGGFRDGYGKMTWADGCSYEGNWAYGYPEGYGKFVFHDKDFFEGKWANPFPYVSQSMSSSTRSFNTIGVFGDGFGKGYVAWLGFKQEMCCDKYDKEAKDLEMIVQGVEEMEKVVRDLEARISLIREEELVEKAWISKEGGKYIGDLVGSTRQGKGKQLWPNGNTYIGDWFSDNPHGSGISTWPDSSKYIGSYQDYFKEGIGLYIWSDKNLYIGEWSQDLMHGLGKYRYTDGREYIGEWKFGQMEGFGKFVWNDGRVYEGEWKVGKKHGFGTTTCASGTKSSHTWNLGKIKD